MNRRAFFGWLIAAGLAWIFRRPIPPRPPSGYHTVMFDPTYGGGVDANSWEGMTMYWTAIGPGGGIERHPIPKILRCGLAVPIGKLPG